MVDVTDQYQVPWTMSDLIMIFLFTLGIVSIVGELMIWGFKALGVTNGQTMKGFMGLIGNVIQNVSLTILSMAFIVKKYRYPLKNLFRADQPFKVILQGIVGGVTILLSIMVVNSIMVIIFLNLLNDLPPQQPIIELLLATRNHWLFFGYACTIVIITPIAEEIFFRGLVYTYLRGEYGMKMGLFISSAFFGLMHMNLWAFMGTALGGLGLALLYEKTRSLYTAILAHMVWNGIVTIVIFL